ncbi:MAG: metallophosphoesterase [Nitrososphaerota archaeon]
MKILHVSDIHGRIDVVEKIVEKASLEDFDLIVVTGDLTHFGEVEDAEMILDRLVESGRQVFFVPGNCDPRALLKWSPSNPKIKNLHLSLVEFGGSIFMGVGGAVGRYGTLTEFTEEEMREMLSKIKPPENFIMVSHSPPYGLDLDYTGVKHIGSKIIKEFVELHKPRLLMCGHAHEGRGITKLGTTLIVNSGPARDGYCAVIDFGEEVRAELSNL